MPGAALFPLHAELLLPAAAAAATHSKGATRASPPGHPDVPAKYRSIGQPVLAGGSMGTSSYVLTGTQVRVSSLRVCMTALRLHGTVFVMSGRDDSMPRAEAMQHAA